MDKKILCKKNDLVKVVSHKIMSEFDVAKLYGPEDLLDLRDFYLRNKPPIINQYRDKTILKAYGYLGNNIQDLKVKVAVNYESSEIHIEEYFDSVVLKFNKNWDMWYGLQQDYEKRQYNYGEKINFFKAFCCKYCYIDRWSLIKLG